MQRRFVRPLILGLAATLLLGVGPAAAKIPYFSVDVSPPDPVEGEPVIVTVRMWDDAGHTQPATWLPESEIRDLVEFRGKAGRLPVTLQRLDDGSYQAEVTLAAGSWQLVPFPRSGGGVVASGDGYPAPASVTVRERTDTATLAVIAAAGMLGFLGLLVAGQVSRGTRRRRLRSATG